MKEEVVNLYLEHVWRGFVENLAMNGTKIHTNEALQTFLKPSLFNSISCDGLCYQIIMMEFLMEDDRK